MLSTVFRLHLPRRLPPAGHPIASCSPCLGRSWVCSGEARKRRRAQGQGRALCPGSRWPQGGCARSGHSEGTFWGQGTGGHHAHILAAVLPLALLLGAGGGLLTERVQVSDPEDRRDRSARLTETGLTPSSMEALVRPALGRGAGQAMVSPCVPPLSSQLPLLFCC